MAGLDGMPGRFRSLFGRQTFSAGDPAEMRDISDPKDLLPHTLSVPEHVRINKRKSTYV